jgi:hypothetical protein
MYISKTQNIGSEINRQVEKIDFQKLKCKCKGICAFQISRRQEWKMTSNNLFQKLTWAAKPFR